MRRESVIFMITLGIFLSAGCAENGAEEPESAESSVETPAVTPVVPAEVPRAPAEIVETPESTPDPTPVENLTPTEPETPSEAPVETPEAQAEPKTVEVKIEDFAFNPDSVTISPNDTVRWKNLDPITHTVTGSDFSSGTLRDGDSYNVTFTREGVYEYYCSIHSSMEGVVIVGG